MKNNEAFTKTTPYSGSDDYYVLNANSDIKIQDGSSRDEGFQVWEWVDRRIKDGSFYPGGKLHDCFDTLELAKKSAIEIVPL